jgi:hypothetical protein
MIASSFRDAIEHIKDLERRGKFRRIIYICTQRGAQLSREIINHTDLPLDLS